YTIIQPHQQVLGELSVGGDQLRNLVPREKAGPNGRQRLYRDHANPAVQRREAEAIARDERVHSHLLTSLLADAYFEPTFEDQIDRIDVRALRLKDRVARIAANGAERG